MIDFKNKLKSGKVERKTDPKELYNTLDRKSVAGPLRPAQAFILDEWYKKHKDDRDLIVKLHTGEGKTLIGLLILQSMINAGNGPCLYICPNKYLVNQVCLEAEKFGIPFCVITDDNQIPNEFISNEKILITNAHKVFNGKSIFGTDKCVKTGTVILDDSHTCIDIIKNAFTISIEKDQNKNLYEAIFSLFTDDLLDQGEGSFIDIQNGSYETFMLVPYWSWFDKKSEMLRTLSNFLEDNQIKYVWPLIKDKIKDYCCYISGNKIEISPYNYNIDIFGSFHNAKHRILMSATTQDDSFFIKGLSFSLEAVKNPLVDAKQKWSGEKMIIIPSLISDDCDRDLIVTKFSEMNNKKHGMVAIVPSTRLSEQYKFFNVIITDGGNIFDEIEKLRKGNFSKIVLINNRYDGIDLPDESCRVLIIDSMPFFNSLSDRYEEKCRADSEIINKRMAQRIEQGMGRGVRGEKDYCAILIIGYDIVKFVRSVATNKYFSAQTKKQIEIGLEIAKIAQDERNQDENPIQSVFSLIKQMMDRDAGWKEYYTSQMNMIECNSDKSALYEQLVKEQEIEKLFCEGECEKACSLMQKYIDNNSIDELEHGWYLQQLARYYYHIQKDKSIQIQKAAFKKNTKLLKPKIGIEYTKVSYIHQNRLKRIRDFFNKFKNYTEITLAVDATLNNLSFGMGSEKFEEALKEVGEMLGFISQRPDNDIRKGPDNLWCGFDNQYLLFECKSEVEENRQEINKSEAGQMNTHCAWFEEEYGKETKVTRFIIIPASKLSYYSNFTHEVYVIRKNKLRLLKENIKKFIKELRSYCISDIDDQKLQTYIDIHELNIGDFVKLYSEKIKKIR